MKRLFKILHRSNSGFTVVELIVAMAIIGTTMSTVAVNTSGLVNNVEASPAEMNQLQLNTNQVTGQDDVANAMPVEETTKNQADLGMKQREADAAANQMELKIMQTAMDTMMIRQGISQVKPTTSTNNMADFPQGNPLYPNYLRSQTSKSLYSCDSSGLITMER